MATAMERIKKIKDVNDAVIKQKEELVSNAKILDSKLQDALKELGLTNVSQLGKTKEEAEKELDDLLTEAENLLGISN
jgi:hypothetical protein